MKNSQLNTKYLINKYELIAKKSFGQHFLHDKNIINKIINSANLTEQTNVFEVGPGPGSLTIELAKKNIQSITVIEKDNRFLKPLQEIKKKSLIPIDIINQDAIDYNESLLRKNKLINISNLPYNISTTLLIKWILNTTPFIKYILMFQKEVAERIISDKEKKTYSRISVLTQWRFETKILFDVPNTAFFPKPNITSSVILLIPRVKPLYPANSLYLQKVLRGCFSYRRKMLRSSFKLIHKDYKEILKNAEIDDKLRPENLTIKQFCSLARELENLSI